MRSLLSPGVPCIALALATGVLSLATCVMPTDQSDQVSVTIDAPSTLLLEGQTMLVRAHAVRRDDGESTELTGVRFEWSSSRLDLAQVTSREDGSALVTPVNDGVVRIEAVAAELAHSTSGTIEVRVASGLTIDSVRPSVAHYGEQVTVYGVGLGELDRATLGAGDLIADPSTFVGEVQGIGHLAFWVPYPATSDRLLAIGQRGTIAAAPDTTRVIFPDLYHELSAPPPRIDLGGTTFRLPDTLFYNPALAVVNGEGVDAYQFHRDGGIGAVTFTLSTQVPFVTGFDPLVTGEPVPPPVPPGDNGVRSWSAGLLGQHCRGIFITLGRPVPATAPVTVVRALKDVSATDVLVAIYGAPPGGYGITVRDGYHTADSAINPDHHEEDDYCDAADLHPVTLPFADTLSIDNPYDVDWLRFDVPGDPDFGLPTLTTFRTAGRPFGATDSSDVGLLLADTEMHVQDSARTPGSDERLTAELMPGSYYLIVTDQAGVPTRYVVCMALGTDCRFPDEE